MTKLIETTPTFDKWFNGLRDRNGKSVIAARINYVADGLVGNVKPLGGGLFEIKIGFGPGYRVYFVEKGNVVIVLLAGGDKSSQSRDIDRARALIS